MIVSRRASVTSNDLRKGDVVVYFRYQGNERVEMHRALARDPEMSHALPGAETQQPQLLLVSFKDGEGIMHVAPGKQVTILLDDETRDTLET